MKKIKFKDLPANLYFWRRNFAEKFLKLPDDSIIYLGDRESPYVYLINSEELIIANPTTCDNCFQEFTDWPPPKVCPFCKDKDDDRESLELMKKIIAEWCGNTDPHI